ncbi:MAG TPA: PIG-L family deacetylase [Pyrinomonadaceae bacterium]|jgi:LmbE family N-acetylglucosaminyl deacetylase|nr:PIG-L family deacetylase [Pyrinomonadaceae bacterium]
MKLRTTYQTLISILCACAILCSWIAPPALAQEATAPPATAAQSINKADLHQALVDLANTWTVMCVAAHPDDEDGTTLTTLRRRDGVHTVSLFSTYGEGGQNAVGPELYEELGVIRAHETMNAAKIQGSQPYFLGLQDFGFSKSADEAFKVWGHDEALRRMVLKIRELHPDVVITNHDTSSGHGHHQATGRLIIEAFDAAADPKRFPEQLTQVKPWQIQRLFVRGFGGANAQKPAGASDKIFATDPNQIDPVRGTSFAEQALAALQQHATQGPWPKSITEMMRTRRLEGGKLPLIRYRLIREAAGAPAFPENATTPLAGMESMDLALPKIDGRPLTDFLDQPDRIRAALVDWRASQTPSDQPPLERHRAQLFEARANQALAVATGVSLTLSSNAAVLVPSAPATFSINIANKGTDGVHVDDLKFKAWDSETHLQTADILLSDTETIVTSDSTAPKDAKLTVPEETHLYDGLFLGKPFVASANLEIDGARFSVYTELSLAVAPAVEIRKASPAPLVWTPGRSDQPVNFTTVIRNNLATPFRGALELSSGVLGISAVGSNLALQGNETRSVDLRSNAGGSARARTLKGHRENSNYATLMVEDSGAAIISNSVVPVIFSDARVAPRLNVGYVPSFDQTLEHSLAALGVKSKALTIDEIKSADLSSYNTIIIDNRGYEAHPELIAANSRLLEFAQAGGTLIVFYHKDNEWNPDEKKNRPQLAPYPIILDDKRVTDETAPITLLQPRHRLLNFPNRITQADFGNWIQERGLYYPKQWDDHYTALFSTHDPGEAPLTSGLLVADYGKGNYIYTSMVWYRELRAGVPGAYRMFANMISYGHK